MKRNFSPEDQLIIKLLESLKSIEVDYPPKMLTRRRVAFIKQIARRENASVGKTISLQNKEVVSLIKNLTTVKADYPPELLARRRAAFARQVASRAAIRWWDVFRSNIQSKLNALIITLRTPIIPVLRTSLVIGGIVLATYLGFLINGNYEALEVALNASPTRMDVSRPLPVAATVTLEIAETICNPGSLPPLCLAQRVETTQVLSYQGNGVARPAVAKDTVQGFDGVHQPSHINDGLYGSGASWVSKTANSWIKIDLGKTMPINTISFGKDRLGNINGRNPGQFTIAVASHDNVYANGDSSNDANEYNQVYDSKMSGFSGVVSGSETIQATFEPVLARYVKITVTNPGTAIDEVEVFFFNEVPPSDETFGKTKEPPRPSSTPTNTLTYTPSPTNTPSRTPTNTPTRTPTDTPTNTPTNTPTPIPTNTPTPTNTSTPVPTSTPLPTNTSTPIPTSTPWPPTNTFIPTSTQFPVTVP